MKIYLADLAHSQLVDDTSLTIPLGIGYIKAYAMETHGTSVEISLFKHPERLLARSEEKPPEIIGFANYGWNNNLNLAIGRYLRKKWPDALFVAGGPNIDPDQKQRLAFLKLHDYLDLVIIDGGEEPFSELINWQQSNRNHNNLPANLIWRKGNTIFDSGVRPLTKVIQNIPSPYLNGCLDEFIEAGMVPMFETNRGCPFRCTFCAWGEASKNLVRQFEQDTSLAEIDYVGARSRVSNWIFCDANFGILKRDVKIAKAIRSVKDRYGTPDKCHIWLAKNVTERNLEIGEILGDMTFPVMAVQSLDNQVLINIKRGNISTDTYAEYQQKFHALGSRTYSDLIVPLPGETLDTHLDGLRQLFEFDVDTIMCHNMRLLAGAETNSAETRQEYGFRTRYRLIHGDAGAYKAPDGSVIHCFEYEESLRQTTTMTESEVFYLRKLHFLVDFFWNNNVYKTLLKLLKKYGVNPIEVLKQIMDSNNKSVDISGKRIKQFWNEFDQLSQDEWFDSREQIETYFLNHNNFKLLFDQDKLNIHFSIVILKDYKRDFDRSIRHIALQFAQVPADQIHSTMDLVASLFPPLDYPENEQVLDLPDKLAEFDFENNFECERGARKVRLVESEKRRIIKKILKSSSNGKTLSKILNTQGISLEDLRFKVDKTFVFNG